MTLLVLSGSTQPSLTTQLPLSTQLPPPATASPQSSELTLGDKIGIGIGVSMGIIILSFLGWLTRRKSRKSVQNFPNSDEVDGQPRKMKQLGK